MEWFNDYLEHRDSDSEYNEETYNSEYNEEIYDSEDDYIDHPL
jgi:hypothetical protein